jgi:P27 family predicted phage terminase small subunit
MAETIPIRLKRVRPAPVAPPLRAVKSPAPPKTLSRESRSTWRSITEEWVLGVDALGILRGALESWDAYQRCRDQVARDGPTFTTPSGMIRLHPASKAGLDAFAAYRQAMRQLGLQPEDK